MASSITLTRPVLIKTIVTESFRRSYIAEMEDTLRRVEELIKQIEIQLRRLELERTITEQSRAVRQQLDLERARQEAYRADLQARLREAQTLELNTEFTQGTVESLVEVKVGDNLLNKLTRAEIVVKDGIVMEIREG